MVAVLHETRYKYNKAMLVQSNVEFTGEVRIREGKVYSTGYINCMYDEKPFSFSLNNDEYEPIVVNEEQKEWKEPRLSVSNWPSGLSVNDTVEEFKTFVLADIKG